MSPELSALLQRLVGDPGMLVSITPEQERAILASLRSAVVEPRSISIPIQESPATAWSEGDLLTVDEAAAVLRVTPRWLYRHAKKLPFVRKLSRKSLRFSRSGITRWLATRRP